MKIYVVIFMTSMMFRWNGYFDVIGECEKYWFYCEFWCFDGWNFDGWDGILDEFIPYYSGNIGWVRFLPCFAYVFDDLGSENGWF